MVHSCVCFNVIANDAEKHPKDNTQSDEEEEDGTEGVRYYVVLYTEHFVAQELQRGLVNDGNEEEMENHTLANRSTKFSEFL